MKAIKAVSPKGTAEEIDTMSLRREDEIERHPAIKLFEETLSDGSKVYNGELRPLRIEFVDRKEAFAFYSSLASLVSQAEGKSVEAVSHE